MSIDLSFKSVQRLCLALIFFGTANLALASEGKKASGKKDLTKKVEAKKDQNSASSIQLIKLNGSDGKDIVQVASDSKDHSTLVTAVVAADLVDTLSGPGPYTIFAPTNKAFEKLPKGTVEELLKPENKLKLKSILEHHAAAPAYNPSILAGMTEVDMVDGPKLKVVNFGGKITVDNVEVKAAISAKNGVIYVIDTVLVPK